MISAGPPIRRNPVHETCSAAISPGGQVIDRSAQIESQGRGIKALAADLRGEDAGALSIATTHTQARYVLPPVLKRFREKYPNVRLHLHQVNSEQIADLASTARIDLAIATGARP